MTAYFIFKLFRAGDAHSLKTGHIVEYGRQWRVVRCRYCGWQRCQPPRLLPVQRTVMRLTGDHLLHPLRCLRAYACLTHTRCRRIIQAAASNA
jgi:hypothetical protein